MGNREAKKCFRERQENSISFKAEIHQTRLCFDR
jgi:hypothetical protein